MLHAILHFYLTEFKEDLIWFHYQNFYNNSNISSDCWKEKTTDKTPDNLLRDLFRQTEMVYTYLTYDQHYEASVFRYNLTRFWLQAQRCMASDTANAETVDSTNTDSSIDLSSYDYLFYLRLTEVGEAKKSHEELIYNHIARYISGHSGYTIPFIKTILEQEHCLLLFDLPTNVPVSRCSHDVVKTNMTYSRDKTKIFITFRDLFFKESNMSYWSPLIPSKSIYVFPGRYTSSLILFDFV